MKKIQNHCTFLYTCRHCDCVQTVKRKAQLCKSCWPKDSSLAFIVMLKFAKLVITSVKNHQAYRFSTWLWFFVRCLVNKPEMVHSNFYPHCSCSTYLSKMKILNIRPSVLCTGKCAEKDPIINTETNMLDFFLKNETMFSSVYFVSVCNSSCVSVQKLFIFKPTILMNEMIQWLHSRTKIFFFRQNGTI